MDTSRVRAVVLDIEGTTTPVSFVFEVLFPYARRHVEAFLEAHWDDPGVQGDVEGIRRLGEAEGSPVASEPAAVAAVARSWMDQDRKATPLKSLQGRIWRRGYAAGELQSQVYPDVVRALQRWAAAGVPVSIYSSGSVEAQKLLFGHTEEGDLTGLLAGYFDTTTGPKREAGSYRRIAEALGRPAGEVLFLTDLVEEARAAREAGLQAALVARAGGAQRSAGSAGNDPAGENDFPVLEDFDGL